MIPLDDGWRRFSAAGATGQCGGAVNEIQGLVILPARSKDFIVVERFALSLMESGTTNPRTIELIKFRGSLVSGSWIHPWVAAQSYAVASGHGPRGAQFASRYRDHLGLAVGVSISGSTEDQIRAWAKQTPRLHTVAGQSEMDPIEMMPHPIALGPGEGLALRIDTADGLLFSQVSCSIAVPIDAERYRERG